MDKNHKPTELKAVHELALERFGEINAITCDEKDQALEDRRFASVPGASWEGAWGELFENKPKIEVNKPQLACTRIYSEYRDNRITVDFVPRDGSESDDLADVCDGLFRSDEQDSDGQEAYDVAFDEGITGGFGAFRLIAKYEDDYDAEDDRQRICFEPIYEADQCVFFDPDAKKFDKSDADYAFILVGMTHTAYEDEWDEDPTSWPKETQTQHNFDWVSKAEVFVAEYYVVDEIQVDQIYFKDAVGNEFKRLEEDISPEEWIKYRATNTQEVKRRKIKQRAVFKYVLSGGKVLDGPERIPGKHIPICPFYARRWYIEGVERSMGHVRLVKDISRLKNMQYSRLAETSAKSPIEKPLLSPDQVAGHTQMWADDVVEDYPYLLINPIEDAAGNPQPAGPIGYTKSPAIPQALAALLDLTEQDMKEMLGDTQLDQLPGQMNEDGIDMVEDNLGMQTFLYVSNFAKALRRAGQVWLSMATELYVESGRRMKMVTREGKTTSIEIGKAGPNGERVDLRDAKFNVYANVGPGSSTSRRATVRALSKLSQRSSDPQTQQILNHSILMNMEGEGISDLRDYARMQLVRMGVIEPSDKEAEKLAQEAQAQGPDANEALLLAEARKSEAEALTEQARAQQLMASANKANADAFAKIMELDLKERDQALSAWQTFNQPQSIQ